MVAPKDPLANNSALTGGNNDLVARVMQQASTMGIPIPLAKQEALRIAMGQKNVIVDVQNGEPIFQDASILKTQFSRMPQGLQDFIVSSMEKMNIRVTPYAIESFLGNYFDYAAGKFQLSGEIEPWYLGMPGWVNGTLQGLQQAEQARGGGGGPTKAVNLTDPGTAKQLMNQSLQQYLGRDATPRELRKFVDALNAAEMGAPREQVVVGDTAVTRGGFNPATFAQDYAAGMQGAGEFQAVTAGLDNFISALANPMEVL